MMTYFLDSNVLIHSKNYEFSFEATPDFWELILKLARQKILVIAQEVYKELSKWDDDLAEWVKQHKKELVVAPSESVYKSLREFVLVAYLEDSETKAETFLETVGADPWVIAHAHACGGVVISLEKERAPGQTKPKPTNRKIPTICRELNVKQMSLAKFLWTHRKIV